MGRFLRAAALAKCDGPRRGGGGRSGLEGADAAVDSIPEYTE